MLFVDQKYYLSILILPLLSFFGLFFFGRFIGKYGAIWFSVSLIFVSFFITIDLVILTYMTQNVLYYTIGTWVDSVGPLLVTWDFQFDILTLSMLTTVLLVSLLVHIYSWNYMASDPFLIRFLSLLSLFTFFMLILLSSGNFLQLFLGWEGIGICSYFLIGFWHTRIQANKSALKAIIVNRIGDIAFLFAMGFINFCFCSLDFSIVFSLTPLYASKTIFLFGISFNILEVICFWLMIAAIGKSAQLGLHIWLPDAMEGPTPVSALIHAATMVTAGIFLIVRCSFIFEYAPTTLLSITLIGSMTAIFAATSGLVQNDIKKVIAYSTCSQLGYMFYSCGLSNYIGSMFHLINHAFFKALLFLSAGSVIHAMSNEQDMRKMGNLKQFLPVTYISLFIGSLALTGFPFLAGFYSKDFILESALFSPLSSSFFAFILTTIAALFTLIYSLRLTYLVFITPFNGFKIVFKNIHESSWFLLTPLLILCMLSLFSGFIFKDLFIGPGTATWANSVFISQKTFTLVDIENLLTLKILPVFFSFFTIILFSFSYIIYMYFVPKNNNFTISWIFNFLIHKWYFDYMFYKILKPIFLFCYTTWVILDKGLLEIIQPIFFTTSLDRLSQKYTNQLSNNGSFYFFLTLWGFLILLVYIYFFI